MTDAPKDWLEAELMETLDEDYEIELEDAVLSEEIRRIYRDKRPEQMDRKLYFRELLRLQTELIKLQDWVSHHKEKVVVIFEGRDSAGKGGAIKRVTQRLNPRVCRVVGKEGKLKERMRVPVRMAPEVYEALRVEARSRGVSMSQYLADLAAINLGLPEAVVPPADEEAISA